MREIREHTEIVTTFCWFNRAPATSAESMFVTGSLDTTLRVYKDYSCIGVLKDHKGVFS
jgi:hypothetical protein